MYDIVQKICIKYIFFLFMILKKFKDIYFFQNNESQNDHILQNIYYNIISNMNKILNSVQHSIFIELSTEFSNKYGKFNSNRFIMVYKLSP